MAGSIDRSYPERAVSNDSRHALSRGALRMAGRKVIVKRLASIRSRRHVGVVHRQDRHAESFVVCAELVKTCAVRSQHRR